VICIKNRPAELGSVGLALATAILAGCGGGGGPGLGAQTAGVTPCAVTYDFVRQFGNQGPIRTFALPAGVAVGSDGSVYVADTFNNRIQRFTNTGGFVGKWGSYGFGNGQFAIPEAVAVNKSGEIYVAGENRIEEFQPSG
jgi:DNA-binding beta-propeller fold protein YncE